jgi:hypothetical protein
MARPTKPVVIDGKFAVVPSEAKLADVVPPNAVSVLTDSGKLVPRSEYATTPIPDGFETNLSSINKG